MMKMSLFAVGIFFAASLLYGEVQFTADTSRPEMSTYATGEEVLLNFDVAGLKEKDLKLELNIVDEHGQTVEKKEIPVAPGADGSWKYSHKAPNGKLGFYRVYCRLSNGVTMPKLGSRPVGFITYCIVPDPAKRILYPDTETFFGMSGGFNQSVNVAPYLGIRWIHELPVVGSAGWDYCEPDRAGQFAEKVAKAKQENKTNPSTWYHMEVNGTRQPWKTYTLPSLFFAPKWAVKPETLAYCTGTLTAEGEKAWEDFCFQLAKLQAEMYPDMKERVYQITWEPVYPWGFKGTDKDFIRIYEIAYPAIHKADPRAVVVGPTYSGLTDQASLVWHDNLFKKGLGKYLDGFSIHPYKTIPPESAGIVEKLRALKEIIYQYTGKNLPMYGTEQGCESAGTPEAELAHARGLLRANLIMMGEGYRANFVFYIHDCGVAQEEAWGYYYNLVKSGPSGPDKTGPKPVAPGYAAQSFLLEGHKSSEVIEWLGDTALGYVFERPESVILALWDFGDTPREVSIPTGTKDVEVYDWMGNMRVMPTDNGKLKLTLTPEPVYIRGVSSSVWGSKAEKPVQLKDSRIKSYPGGEIIVSGKAKNQAEEARTVKVSIELDKKLNIAPQEQEIKIGLKQENDFSFKIKLPANSPLGSYPVRVSMKNGEDTSVAGLMVTLSSPITIEQICPVLQKKDGLGIKIKMRETLGKGFAGKIQTSIKGVPDSKKQADVTIGGKEEKEIVIPYADISPEPTRIYALKIILSTKDGYRTEEDFPVNFLFAKKIVSPVTVDGNIAEWKGTAGTLLKGRERIVRSEKYYSGDNDLEAKAGYAWDDNNMYISYEVTDDAFVQDNTGFNTWKGDCIQLGFNLDYGKKQEAKTGNTWADIGSEMRISEIVVALTKTGPEAYRSLTFDKEAFPIKLLSSSEISLAVKREGNRIIYEAAVPWKTLGMTRPPQEGELYGVYATVNDMDESAQPDPSAFGLFVPATVEFGKQFGMMVLE